MTDSNSKWKFDKFSSSSSRPVRSGRRDYEATAPSGEETKDLNERTPLFSSTDRGKKMPFKVGSSVVSARSGVDTGTLAAATSGRGTGGVPATNGTRNPPNNNDRSQSPDTTTKESACCDEISELCLQGFCPPESYYKSKPILQTKPWQIWHAWYPTPNLKAIFIRDRDSNLNCLDGVRALAYMWVLNDHLYQVFNASVPGFTAWWTNYGGITVVERGEKGDQGVTSFFVLSGFLIPFILTKEVAKRKERYLSFWTGVDFLFHRWVRLAPTLYVSTCLAILYGYYSTSAYSRVAFYDNCVDYWWLNFVFMENFFGLGKWKDCYDSVWTISVEMQLYVLTLPVVYFFVWEKHYGYIAALCFFSISFVIKMSLAQWVTDGGGGSPSAIGNYNQLIYLAPWSRAAEYGIGIMLFMVWDRYVYEKEKKEKALAAKRIAAMAGGDLESLRVAAAAGGAAGGNAVDGTPAADADNPLVLKVMFFAAAIGFIVFAFFFLSVQYASWWNYSVYHYYAFTYTIWALGLVSVIYLALDPPFWPFAQLLGMNIWYPIASLAYTGGVLNIMVCAIYAEMLTSLSPNNTWPSDTKYYWKFLIFTQTTFISLMLGVALSLLVERPFMQLGQRIKFHSATSKPMEPAENTL